MRKFGNVNGTMEIGGVSTVDLVERYGTPLYVTDEGAVRQNYRRIHDAFRPYMPVRVHFACKANWSLAILRILYQEGSHIDAVSVNEVDACLRAGFPPGRILYTGVSVSTEELYQVASRGVKINIDSFSEMRRLAEMTTDIQVSLRLNPGVGAGHHAHVVTGAKTTKFGIPKEQIVQAYEEALQLGFMPFGIHSHIGAGVQEVGPFTEVTDVLVSVANELEDKLGLKLKVIDIGGGVGIPYRPEEKVMDVDLYAKEVCARIKGHCSADTVAIEPGRYIIADTTVLLTRVNDVKETPEKKFLGVDAGFNTLVRPAFYGSYHHIAVANRFEAQGEQVYDVVGPLCESGDFIGRDRMLPRVEEGDLLAVYDAGAYGFTMSSNYNMRPRCREVLTHEGEVYLIHEGESLNDLLRLERIPARLMI